MRGYKNQHLSQGMFQNLLCFCNEGHREYIQPQRRLDNCFCQHSTRKVVIFGILTASPVALELDIIQQALVVGKEDELHILIQHVFHILPHHVTLAPRQE